jgi:hypothetical protein
MKLARLRRPKITCPPSYVDYRPKTNAVILLLIIIIITYLLLLLNIIIIISLQKTLQGRDRTREGNQKLECA